MSTFKESDLLVEFEDVAGEYSDAENAEPPKHKKSSKQKNTDSNMTSFNMRMHEDEKFRLERLSKSAGTDMSSFIRKRVFSDEGIIVLDKKSDLLPPLVG
jgi:hypothetical protein